MLTGKCQYLLVMPGSAWGGGGGGGGISNHADVLAVILFVLDRKRSWVFAVPVEA